MVRLTVQKCLFWAQRYPKLLGRSAWCQWGQIDIFPAQYCSSHCTKYKQYKQMKKSNTTLQQNLFILAIFSWDTWWSITFWRSGGCFIVSHNAVFVWSKHVLLQGKFRQTSFTKTKMLHRCLLYDPSWNNSSIQFDKNTFDCGTYFWEWKGVLADYPAMSFAAWVGRYQTWQLVPLSSFFALIQILSKVFNLKAIYSL